MRDEWRVGDDALWFHQQRGGYWAWAPIPAKVTKIGAARIRIEVRNRHGETRERWVRPENLSPASGRARVEREPRVKAMSDDLLDVLEEAEATLAECFRRLRVDDEPCGCAELCGDSLCDEVGCVSDKMVRLRSAIAEQRKARP